MNKSCLIKEVKIFFRNKTVILTMIFMFAVMTSIVLRSLAVIPSGIEISPIFSFKFLQQQSMIMFFPVILTNILIIAFSVTAEKQTGMLSRLLPGGEAIMMRSKVIAGTIISSVLSFSYLILALLLSDLNFFLSYGFVILLVVSYFFILSGLAAFSVSFAFKYYDGSNNYEPELKGMLGYMLIVSFSVIVFYFFLSLNLRYYYEYVMGYRITYPNIEFTLFLGSSFVFLILARLMLNGAERKLSWEKY